MVCSMTPETGKVKLWATPKTVIVIALAISVLNDRNLPSVHKNLAGKFVKLST